MNGAIAQDRESCQFLFCLTKNPPWIGLLLMTIFGINELVLQTLVSPVILVVTLSIVYVLGIVTNRIADVIFESLFAAKIRRQWFAGLEDYYQARMKLFEHEQLASELLEYGRSRLRICRGLGKHRVIR